MNLWRPLNKPELGLANTLSNFISTLEKTSIRLPDFHQTKRLVICSDYGGEHRKSNFRSYTFLIIDGAEINSFVQSLARLRQQYRLGSRIIEFKKLNDGVRMRALNPFLQLANNPDGIMISCLVHKSLHTLFDEKVNMNSEIMEPFRIWKKGTFEKILRIVNFMGIFIGGLSHPGQDLYWITDEDDIVANNLRLSRLINLFAGTVSHYVNFNLGHFKCGRTNLHSNLEDLCSLTDLTSGAIAHLISERDKSGSFNPLSQLLVLAPKNTKKKVHVIGAWMNDSSPEVKLKKLCFTLTKGINDQINIAKIDFHNLYDYKPSLIIK